MMAVRTPLVWRRTAPRSDYNRRLVTLFSVTAPASLVGSLLSRHVRAKTHGGSLIRLPRDATSFGKSGVAGLDHLRIFAHS
jgi:hypothetical protein